MLQIFRSVVDDPVARAAPAPADIIDRPSDVDHSRTAGSSRSVCSAQLGRTARWNRRASRAHPPPPRPGEADIIGRPDPESLKWNRRRRPAAAAPPSRLERVGLVAELDVAARPRARVWVASQVN